MAASSAREAGLVFLGKTNTPEFGLISTMSILLGAAGRKNGRKYQPDICHEQEVNMSDIILHHYEMSPFSEKVRKYFAVKNMGWAAVEQPNIAPKPALTPLTGGYRRIPVMQIGAHIYCDTALIIDTLEARHPEPPLTPPHLRGAAAIAGRLGRPSRFHSRGRADHYRSH